MVKTNLLTYIIIFSFVILVYFVGLYVTTPPTELAVLELMFGTQLALFIVLTAIYIELRLGRMKGKKRDFL